MSKSEHSTSNDGSLSLATLPKTTLQSIYHAVTGKTESMSDNLSGNVIIERDDINSIYERLIDQINVHNLEFSPTTTVTVKSDDSKVINYSSWERYQKTFSTNDSITSEVIIKIECVFDIPGSVSSQRCVINLSFDSSMPLLASKKFRDDISNGPGLMFFSGNEWSSVFVSIDYVDFVVAKSILYIVKEWFEKLKKTPQKKYSKFLSKNIVLIRRAARNSGILFISALMISTYFHKIDIHPNDLIILCGISAVFLYIMNVFSWIMERNINKAMITSFIPTVILLSKADVDKFEDLKNQISDLQSAFINSFLANIFSIISGLASSYIYSFLTGK